MSPALAPKLPTPPPLEWSHILRSRAGETLSAAEFLLSNGSHPELVAWTSRLCVELALMSAIASHGEAPPHPAPLADLVLEMNQRHSK